MKYIKSYEKMNREEREFMNSLHRGDYVIITSPDFGVYNELMILTTDPDENFDGFTFHAKDMNGEHYETYYDHEIVRIPTLEEIELTKATKKYNL